MVQALFEAFNRREVEAVLELCQPQVEFMPVTAQYANQGLPYIGHAGIRRYFEDVERTWDELQVTATEFHAGPDSEVLLSCRTLLSAAGNGLIDRAKQAGVIREDATFADVGRMVAGIAMVPTADPGQQERMLDLALDGLRYRGA